MALSSSSEPFDEVRLKWMIILHLTFIVSGVLFAVMDYVASRSEKAGSLAAPGA